MQLNQAVTFSLFMLHLIFSDTAPDYNVRDEKAHQRMSCILRVVCVCAFYLCPDEL